MVTKSRKISQRMHQQHYCIPLQMLRRRVLVRLGVWSETATKLEFFVDCGCGCHGRAVMSAMESATERSERKRQREKQRRSDLAAAFDELANVLLQVEKPEASRISQGNGKLEVRESSDHSEGVQSITRLDLITETVGAIKRMHAENTKLRSALMARGGQAAVNDALQNASVLSSPSAGGASLQHPVRLSSIADRSFSLPTPKADQAPMSLHARAPSVPTNPSMHAATSQAPQLQQQGLSYQQMAQMALQQFNGAPGAWERNKQLIDTAPGSSHPRTVNLTSSDTQYKSDHKLSKLD